MNRAFQDGWLAVLTGDDATEGGETARLCRQEKPQRQVKGGPMKLMNVSTMNPSRTNVTETPKASARAIDTPAI